MIWTYLAHPKSLQPQNQRKEYALGLCSFENCPWKSPNFQNLDPHLYPMTSLYYLYNIINNQQLTIT